MVGVGSEILFVLMLGLLVLGPKRLHAMLAHLARAKAEFEHASRGFKSQLEAELDPSSLDGKTDSPQEAGGAAEEARVRPWAR
jgi:Sec-independent protein translocase protein TatA